MKRIHFDHLEGFNIWMFIVILSLVFILIGIFEPFYLENTRIYKYISSVGFLLQAIYFSKLFWYKNTVQWNKKGIIIRIKSFLGKSLRFDEIKEIEKNEKEFTIIKIDGKKMTFDIKDVVKSDIQKLNKMLLTNII